MSTPRCPARSSTVEAGTYPGDLIIDRPLHLIGIGRPTLVGSGKGSVVRIRADDVTVEGFDIDGRNGGSLEADSAGVHVAASRATIRDCRIVRTLFGIYLREANESRVERCVIEGTPGKDPGEQGSGIHIFNATGFTLLDNTVRYSRDGFYLQSASHGFVANNTVSDVRYGLHYMFSDDNVFEDNSFERSAAGAALMYSKRIQFRRNRFLHNRGFASVGLLMQACDDVVAEDNLIADNARGIFLEGSSRDLFRRNVVAQSDTALVLYDSSSQNRFVGNSFVANLSPLLLVGRRTDTVFDGNYWSDHDEPDLDGDGIREQPYRLSNVFDHLRGNLTAADLFAQGLGRVGALGRRADVPRPRSDFRRRRASVGSTATTARRPVVTRHGPPRQAGRTRGVAGLPRRGPGRSAVGPGAGVVDGDVPPVLETLRPCRGGEVADVRGRARRGRRPARPERLRQDHVDQGGGRPDPAQLGPGAARVAWPPRERRRDSRGVLLPAPARVVPGEPHGPRGPGVLLRAARRYSGAGS